jgi:hypothetical protein
LPHILKRLPYSDHQTSVVVGGREEAVKVCGSTASIGTSRFGHRDRFGSSSDKTLAGEASPNNGFAFKIQMIT